MSQISKAVRAIALVTAMILGLAIFAAGAEEKNVRFALTGTVMFGSDFEGEMGGLMGPGLSVYLDLAKVFMISGEVMWILYWGSLAPACSLNLRIGKYGYVGAGPFVTSATHDRASVVSFKAHLGFKFGHALVEVSYVTAKPSSHTWGGKPALLGLTFGFVF